MSEERDDRVEAAPEGVVAPTAEEAPTGDPSMESMLSMDELMANYDAAQQTVDLRPGALVTGIVVQISENGVMVDVGAKSEGLIPKGELEAIRDLLEVGKEIQVVVTHVDHEDGSLTLSKRQADAEAAWERIVDKQEENAVLEARVVDAVKGGLLVDLGLYGQGFVPASHVSIRRPRNLNKYIGQTLKLQVIEVERKRKRVVLSHRLVVEREREAERGVTLQKLREGQVRRGVVRRITDFGAFVDIGGVDGLLHVSELSWKRVGSPGEELRVGEPLEVMVLKLNLDEGRISLGRRQLLKDPWREIPKLYREGQTVRGTVTKLLGGGERAVVKLPVGWDVVVDVPEELRQVVEAPVAEATEAVEPSVTEVAPVATEVALVEGAEPVVADVAATEEAHAEAALAEPASEQTPAVEEAALAGAALAEAPVAEAPVAAVATPAAEAPATEAAAPEAASRALVVGGELELRVERLIAAEREIVASVAGSRPISERGPGRLTDAERSQRAPLARGRYSDRRDEEGEREGEARGGQTQRRDRRRDRDADRDRDLNVLEQASMPPARRTLGDLMGDMGDKLRALLQGGEESDEQKPSQEE